MVPLVSSFGRLVTAGSSGEVPFSSNAPPNCNLLLILLVVFSGFLSLFFLFLDVPL